MQPIQPPQNCSIEEFLLEEKYGRHAIQASLNPFTCGLTSKTRTTVEVKQLVTELAQGLGDKLGWHAIPSDQLERVVCIFSANSVYFPPSSRYLP